MKKILVVVDMQKDFIDGALGSADAAAIVDNVVEKINHFDGEILVTYDTHQDNYLETREGKYLPVKHCIEGTEGWNLHEKVEKALQDKQAVKFVKPTFGSVELVHYLSRENEKDMEVTLIGLCTDICVVSNAMLLKAHFPEIDITVDASCCAGVTKESHDAALVTMQSCQINVVG